MNPLFVDPYVLIKQYGDSVLYKWNEASMEYDLVNKTGAEILELCDGNKSVTQIINEMASRYSEEYNRTEKLVKKFLCESINQGYVVEKQTVT